MSALFVLPNLLSKAGLQRPYISRFYYHTLQPVVSTKLGAWTRPKVGGLLTCSLFLVPAFCYSTFRGFSDAHGEAGYPYSTSFNLFQLIPHKGGYPLIPNFPENRGRFPSDPRENGQPSFTAKNTLLTANALVFVLARTCSFSDRLAAWFSRHFIASWKNIFSRRWHCLFLASVSHVTLSHFFLNFLALYLLLGGGGTLERRMTSNEMYGCYFGAGIAGALGQLLACPRASVLGASAGLAGFISLFGALDASTKFLLFFPIPGLCVTGAQLTHLCFAINLLGLFFLRKRSTIGWVAHLVGLGFGATYATYRRIFLDDPRFKHSLFPSGREIYLTWKNSFLELYITVRLYWLEVLMKALHDDPVRWAQLRRETERLKEQQRALRRLR